MSNSFLRILWTSIVFCILTLKLAAQQFPYVRIPQRLGIQTVGGVNITTTWQGVSTGVGPFCGDYSLYSSATYGFSFAVPVRAIKYNVLERYIDTVGFYINNTFYSLSSANISPYSGPTFLSICIANQNYTTGISANGYLATATTGVGTASDVIFTSGSSPVVQSSILGTSLGVITHGYFNIYFQAQDTFMTIVQPYLDTLLCAGDSLKVSFQVTSRFRSNNSFTVQLSDSNGSFSPINPTIIGSKQTDTTGIIACYIPPSTPTRPHYKIRIVSNAPFRTSGDNIVNIAIGNHPPPKPTASNNSPICLGDSIKLSAIDTGMVTSYTWAGPVGFRSDLQFPTFNSTTLSNAGNYIVTAATYGCKAKDTTTVAILPTPAKPNFTTNSPVCTGDTIKLTATSSLGVSYNWTGPNSFTSAIQNPIILNASANVAGRYITTLSWSVNNCIYKDSVNIIVKPLPTKPIIISNAPICLGDSLQLNSPTTTSGVTFKWSGPNGFNATTKDTGINNSNFSHSGDYIITVTLNGCMSKDTESVLIKPFPQSVTAGSNTPVCPGTTLNLNASCPTSGIAWDWTGPGNYSDTSQNASRSNMQTAWAGTYTATATLNGCSVSANTNVASYITTPTPTASANTPVCYGGTLYLTASSIPGAVYVWSGPNNYQSNVQNATRTNMSAADAGVYTVNANVNGCISQTAVTQAVTLVTGPSVSAYASPGSSICTGSNVALVAVPYNIGPNPASYDWYKNGTSTGGTGSSYIAPTPNNGDVFYVMMTAGTACNTPISSNSITITTLPTTPPPAAIIAASPGTDVWPGLNVNFNVSNITNGGSSPAYQWKLNGVSITGATTNKWNSTQLKDGDSVCLLVTSSDQCATPKSALSNCLKMKVPTRVGPLNPLGGDLAVYPNPNRGEFYLTLTHPKPFGLTPLERGMLTVTDVTGRVIATYSITETKTLIQLPASISAGVYVGKYTGADGDVGIVRIVVE